MSAGVPVKKMLVVFVALMNCGALVEGARGYGLCRCEMVRM
ncbi:hypothetical protein [Segniliparus rugosus]|nr:hypothetical protein [Segniliparus rugosus]